MEQMSCFGEDHGTLGALMRTLIDRKDNAPAGSYTKVLGAPPAVFPSSTRTARSQTHFFSVPVPSNILVVCGSLGHFVLSCCTLQRLFDDSILLKSKLLEECEELLAADNKKEVAFETADVIYFAFAACARHGVNLAEVQRSLARKHLRVRRRSKPRRYPRVHCRYSTTECAYHDPILQHPHLVRLACFFAACLLCWVPV